MADGPADGLKVQRSLGIAREGSRLCPCGGQRYRDGVACPNKGWDAHSLGQEESGVDLPDPATARPRPYLLLSRNCRDPAPLEPGTPSLSPAQTLLGGPGRI